MDEAEDTMRTVRDGRFRYILNYHPDRPYAQYLDYAEKMSTWRELRRLRKDESMLRGRGEVPMLLTPVQRRFLATAKPREELYDLAVDPHEVNNLAGDDRYSADLQRLRKALADWQQTYGDLGLMPEEELIERWRPGGVHPVTEPPQLHLEAGQVVASCPTPGASIAWTTDPPQPLVERVAATSGAWTTDPLERAAGPSLSDMTGAPQSEGRSWRLYSGSVKVTDGVPLWFRACRLGYRDSDDVMLIP
jgi:uncharacterized sulfatase